jgi:hypothetical protein
MAPTDVEACLSHITTCSSAFSLLPCIQFTFIMMYVNPKEWKRWPWELNTCNEAVIKHVHCTYLLNNVFLQLCSKCQNHYVKKFPDELQRAYPLLQKLCKAVNKAWCAPCSSVKLERERSDCWVHRNTANKTHVSSGSLHSAHEVNLFLQLKNQPLYTIQLPNILI